MSMSRVGLRRRGRATTQRALGCHRSIAACTWYRAAVARALVQVLYKHHGAIFFGGRWGTRARATENLFQPLLLPPLLAPCLVDYLETEIQTQSSRVVGSGQDSSLTARSHHCSRLKICPYLDFWKQCVSTMTTEPSQKPNPKLRRYQPKRCTD
jgi:hypothetical protein